MEILPLGPGVVCERSSPAVTVGNFDGVHRGHQALVKVALQEARAMEGAVVVLTFDPHPSRILSPDRAPASLTTLEQKAEVLEDLGVDVLAVVPFTIQLSQKSYEEFAREVLHQALRASVVVVGSNFRFGRGREGDLLALEGLGGPLGFRVHGVEPILQEGEPISSTRIREALARGAVNVARDLLGRRFFIDGSVIAGAGRGRGLGFPTANMSVVNETLPGSGVYAGWCHVRDDASARAFPSVANVGRRPTFGGTETTVEVHVLDFSGDLYGRPLRFEFEERLREERRFSGPVALVEQVRCDVAVARTILERSGGG